jgi:hypothetical protein
MTLSIRTLKVMSGLGAAAVCGVSGVLVAIDPKPAAAPLHPTVGEASSDAPRLVIPSSCGAGGATAATLDPTLHAVAQQLRAATSPSARRTILAPLTSAQRLDVEAYVRSLRRGDDSGQCAPASDATGSISPSVIDAPASTQPLINTYVS